MKTKIFFDYQIGQTVNFKFEGEYLQLPADCFVTDFSKVTEETSFEAEFVEGFTEEMLWAVLSEKQNEYSKGQLASKGTWEDIKAAWLIEKENN